MVAKVTRKVRSFKLWSAITGVALVVALVLTFLPMQVSVNTGGLLSIDLSHATANPAFTARTETYYNTGWGSPPYDATVNKPTGTVAGDILFCLIYDYYAVLDSVPTGWSQIATTYLGSPSFARFYLYYKIAGSSEPSTYTWSFDTGGGGSGVRIVCSCYTGGDFDPADPIDVVSNTAYTTNDVNCIAASMTVSAVNSPLVFWGSVYKTSAITFTKPSVPTSGWIEDDDAGDLDSDSYIEICSMIWSGSGATGDMSATMSASSVVKHAFAVALNPAPVIVVPTVTTQAATSVLSTSCTGNGNITATGGANATTRGFCYMVGQAGDPTTANSTAYDTGSYGTGTYTKSITGLTPSAYYRVRAYAINSAGTGYGSTVQVTTLPGDPSGLVDTAHNGTSVTLNWTKGTGADYTLIRYGTSGYPTGTSDGTLGYNGTASTTSVGSLSYGQIYYWRAWAWNSTTTLYSSGTSDRTCYTDPNAPIGFQCWPDTNAISLGWTKGTGSDKTRIQYRTDQYPTTYSDGTQAYFNTGTEYTVFNLSAGQVYYFRAWSYDTDSGYYDSYAQLTDYTLPADPSALNANNPTVSTVDVSWTNGTGGDKTMVRYKTGAYPTSTSDGTQLYFDTGTSQQATALNSSTAYYFRCWSYDSDSTYYSSGYSSDTETTLTPAPEITNLPDNYDFGILEVGATAQTTISYFTLNNTGNCPVDVTIQGTNMIGSGYTWVISGTATPGNMIFGMKAGLDDADDLFDVVVNTTANAFIADLPEATTQAWGLKIWAPTSYDDGNLKTGNVTLTAVAG